MNIPTRPPLHTRRSLASRYGVLAAVTLATLGTGCSGGQPVTAESVAAARHTWDAAQIGDYDLEWTASGIMTAHYVVTVRDRTVRKIESIAPNGRRNDVRPAEPRFYGVEGLFTTIADELAQLKTEQPFGQPRGTKVIMRFTPDPQLGYPKNYRRDVMGSQQSLAIDVIRLTPLKTAAHAGSAPPVLSATGVGSRSASVRRAGNVL